MEKIGNSRINLPAGYLQRMERLLGEEYPAFQEIYTQPAASGLRVNTLKVSVPGFRHISPFRLQSLEWTEAGFQLPESETNLQPGKHPYHAAGLYYLQDPSAMAVVEMLDPQPGEIVLDLAAAPGGKATQIISAMRNQGLLVANEMHPRRAWDLAENLERWGARMAAILNNEPHQLRQHFGAFFDRVLVDAPCSGEGMFRKSQAALKAWSPTLVQGCAMRQVNILEEAGHMVRPGGRLVYSTCTFAPEEDEGVVMRFLENHARSGSPRFEVVQARQVDSFSPGHSAWVENKLETEITEQLERTVRLWPHHDAPEGHFIAVFQRLDDGPPATLRPYKAKTPAEARAAFQQFCETSLERAFQAQLLEGLTLEGSYLYACPGTLPPLGKLKAIHPGWWLGQLKANRFEPSHALAMGIQPEQAQRTVIFQISDPALAAYFHGESLRIEGESGWVLVCVKGSGLNKAFPIGWGKQSGGMLKNFYPRGLRWR